MGGKPDVSRESNQTYLLIFLMSSGGLSASVFFFFSLQVMISGTGTATA